MLSVLSAIRRSLTSAAMASASASRGGRSVSRAVSRTGAGRPRQLSGAVRSSNVITRAPRNKRGEPASRLPSWNPIGSAGSMGAGRPRMKVRRLFGRSLRHREYRHEDAALGFGPELDFAVGEREQRVVLGHADIGARVPLGAALARNDVAGQHLLAAENLQAEPLTVGVAAVAGSSACFLVSIGFIPSFARYVMQLCVEIITSSCPCPAISAWPPASRRPWPASWRAWRPPWPWPSGRRSRPLASRRHRRACRRPASGPAWAGRSWSAWRRR